jgi:hypothetical protein
MVPEGFAVYNLQFYSSVISVPSVVRNSLSIKKLPSNFRKGVLLSKTSSVLQLQPGIRVEAVPQQYASRLNVVSLFLAEAA